MGLSKHAPKDGMVYVCGCVYRLMLLTFLILVIVVYNVLTKGDASVLNILDKSIENCYQVKGSACSTVVCYLYILYI